VETQLALAFATAAASSWAAVGTLGWWLSGRFRAVEKATQETIEKHEQIDQRRHDENLGNFNDIRVILARNGINGGPYKRG
jgi:hypothetical protein